MEYCEAIKKHEVKLCVWTWKEMHDRLLKDKRYLRENAYVWSSFCEQTSKNPDYKHICVRYVFTFA